MIACPRVWIGEDLRYLVEPEIQLAVEQDLLQALKVRTGVQPVASGASPARRQQADVVVVVQGPHRYARQPGHLTDGVFLHGDLCLHGHHCAASRSVRVKRDLAASRNESLLVPRSSDDFPQRLFAVADGEEMRRGIIQRQNRHSGRRPGRGGVHGAGRQRATRAVSARPSGASMTSRAWASPRVGPRLTITTGTASLAACRTNR